MSRKIALGFVAYHPALSLNSRISMALDAGFMVYLFDNSPGIDDQSIFGPLIAKGLRYSSLGINAGLGVGISRICSQAYEDNQSALLFFDQDTIFSYETLHFIEEFHKRRPDLSQTYVSIAFNSRKGDQGVDLHLQEVEDVLLTINSGSLFYLENAKVLNWHNSDYFVDGVDYEFCLRADQAGLRIGQISFTPGFDHESEQGNFSIRLFGRDYAVRRYALRRILDTTISNIKLIFLSARLGNIKYTRKFIKLAAGYFFFQLAARLLPQTSKSVDDHS